MIFMKWFK